MPTSPIQDMGIYKNLAKLRRETKLTQEYVAIQMQTMGINMSRSRYSMIELGRYRLSVPMLVALKIIFQCQYEDLFEGLEQELGSGR